MGQDIYVVWIGRQHWGKCGAKRRKHRPLLVIASSRQVYVRVPGHAKFDVFFAIIARFFSSHRAWNGPGPSWPASACLALHGWSCKLARVTPHATLQLVRDVFRERRKSHKTYPWSAVLERWGTKAKTTSVNSKQPPPPSPRIDIPQASTAPSAAVHQEVETAVNRDHSGCQTKEKIESASANVPSRHASQ